MALDFLESVNHHLTHLHQHLLPKICLLVNAALATAAACLVIGSRGKGFKAFFEILLPLETPSNFYFYLSQTSDPKYQPTAVRLLISVLITALLAAHGYRRKSVSLSGMITGS